MTDRPRRIPAAVRKARKAIAESIAESKPPVREWPANTVSWSPPATLDRAPVSYTARVKEPDAKELPARDGTQELPFAIERNGRIRQTGTVVWDGRHT